eukprot:CAMPEP_0195143618 /NCGR_PEP_ID=MMETSP0448-20130528/166667_1 /TAXON_ID=66468 /ORGANISM="Heterocapsa triquestra, Strain CCMP 448" /LENGTH=544 /DNA_ID=CAMNT_0040182057 /DNA_START=29 /DNA_END=1660 /DNA_ORIENTATION=+
MNSNDDAASDSGSENELGHLISFANLENVIKHVIKKFKAIEGRNEETELTLQGLRRDLENRATLAAMEEVSNDTISKLDATNKTLGLQKESISSLELQLERSRSTCNALEKKLEACVKEKAVQDRLIRENQDALQDKVAVAELNMFEAKFSGYTTKLEHQEVISSLSHYARVDVAERIAENVKVLNARFDDYSRTAKIERQLQDVRDWVTDELNSYAKSKPTTEKLDQLQALIRDQSLGFERVHTMTDDKIRGLSDRLTSIYSELNSDIHDRAMAEDLKETQESLRKYALKAHTDAFQQDCIPKLKFCVDSIKAFDERLRAQDDAIQRVDEVLLDKAAKYDIVVMNGRVEQCMPKETAMQEINRTNDNVTRMKKRFEQYIDKEHERMDSMRPPDLTPIVDELNARIRLKADKADLVEMYQLKANRIDADELAKLQDTIHRQLEYLAVTAFGLAKLVLTEAKSSESKTIRTQQKSQVLMQSEALWHWIIHNEPPPNLDTLRPPPAGGRKGAAAPAEQACGDGVTERQKRIMDAQKRHQLEKKLGI